MDYEVENGDTSGVERNYGHTWVVWFGISQHSKVLNETYKHEAQKAVPMNPKFVVETSN